MSAFDEGLNLLSSEQILDCDNCTWIGKESETDNGDCPDCGMQLTIIEDDE